MKTQQCVRSVTTSGGCSRAPWAGTTAPTVEDARLVGLATACYQNVDTSTLAPGARVRYFALWFSRKGEFGPAGDPLDLYAV